MLRKTIPPETLNLRKALSQHVVGPAVGRVVSLLVAVFGCSGVASGVEDAGEPPPPLRSAAEVGFAPFSFVDDYGRAAGFAVELLQASLGAMNRGVDFRTGVWADVRSWLETGQVDVLPLVGRTPEREALYDFTFPYMTLHGAIVVRDGTAGIRTMEDLRGRRVAVMRADNAEEFLRREDRGIKIIPTPTFEQALRELAAGEHDAVVIQRLVAQRLIRELGLRDLRIVGRPIEGFRQDFCFAVPKGDHAMLALLNEGLSLVMADGTFRRLHARWFAGMELPSDRVVIGGDHNYPPYEFLDGNGRPAGYNIELMRAVANEMGFSIEFRLGPWAEILQGLEAGEIDALPGLFYSPDRDRKFDFSQAHTLNHYVSIVRAGEGSPPEGVEDLAGRVVVLQEGDYAHDLLLQHLSPERLILVRDQEDVLRTVREGTDRVGISVRTSALYLIRERGWGDLVIGRRPLLTGEYCFAVPAGNSALLAQLSEGLNMLRESGEYRRIHEKWLGIYDDPGPDYDVILFRIAVVAIPLITLLLAFMFWTWALRRQVARRTAQVRESEQFLRMLVDNIPVGVAVNTVKGEVGFRYMNDLFPKLYRTTREALDREDFWEVVYADPTVRERVRRQVLDDCASGDPARMVWNDVPIHREGEPVTYVCARNIPISGTDLMISTVWDVTERVVNTEALQRSEALMHIASRAAKIGGWTVNIAENRVVWSDEVAQIHEMPAGFSPTVEEGIQFYAPEWRERIRSVFNACATRGDAYDEVLEILTGLGERRWVRTIGEAVRDEAGAIVRVQGAFQDISEDVSLRSQLQQAQKLESVGRLAGGVAHDFNNMLGAIFGYTDLALQQVEPGSPVHHDLEQIQLAANRSADIVRQLLAFARKQIIAPKLLDLNESIEGTLKMLRRLIGENINLVWQPGRDLGAVLLDPSQLDQVLVNLCVNASDAIGSAGTITIETENVDIDEEYCDEHPGSLSGEYVVLVVSDDGAGMTREVREHLFEPFFTTKEAGKGTGLGLSTVYGIVKQNKGFINVYSEPGQGTTFRTYLPRQVEQATSSGTPVATEPQRGRGETILVVEDEPGILEASRLILTRLGYEVLVAASPAEALRRAEGHTGLIDLLITDVVLPGMNGRELAERLRQSRPGLRCLYMSGFTADAIADRGVLYKGVDFIQKPFSMRALATRVRAALDQPERSDGQDQAGQPQACQRPKTPQGSRRPGSS